MSDEWQKPKQPPLPRMPTTVTDAFGHLLDRVPRFPPVAMVFTGGDYLRRLAAIRRRVRAGLIEAEGDAGSLTRGGQPQRRTGRPKGGKRATHGSESVKHKRKSKLIPWNKLTLVSCSVCRVELLGPSSEWVRKKVDAHLRADLPGPLGGRVNDRPVCVGCYRKSREGVRCSR